MKAYQINIFTVKGSRSSNELSCVTKVGSRIEAKRLAEGIVEENNGKYDKIRLLSVKRL